MNSNQEFCQLNDAIDMTLPSPRRPPEKRSAAQSPRADSGVIPLIEMIDPCINDSGSVPIMKRPGHKRQNSRQSPLSYGDPMNHGWASNSDKEGSSINQLPAPVSSNSFEMKPDLKVFEMAPISSPVAPSQGVNKETHVGHSVSQVDLNNFASNEHIRLPQNSPPRPPNARTSQPKTSLSRSFSLPASKMTSSAKPLNNLSWDTQTESTNSDLFGAEQQKDWTAEEDACLRAAIEKHGNRNWTAVAEEVGNGRTDAMCLYRWTKVLRPGLHKGPWTELEDRTVRQIVEEYGVGKVKWTTVATKLPGRIGKQCRERWFNHLDPSIKRSPWTADEDTIVFEAQALLGNKWSEIAKYLPGRTENAVKNRFNSSAHKKWLKDHPDGTGEGITQELLDRVNKQYQEEQAEIRALEEETRAVQERERQNMLQKNIEAQSSNAMSPMMGQGHLTSNIDEISQDRGNRHIRSMSYDVAHGFNGALSNSPFDISSWQLNSSAQILSSMDADGWDATIDHLQSGDFSNPMFGNCFDQSSFSNSTGAKTFNMNSAHSNLQMPLAQLEGMHISNDFQLRSDQFSADATQLQRNAAELLGNPRAPQKIGHYRTNSSPAIQTDAIVHNKSQGILQRGSSSHSLKKVLHNPSQFFPDSVEMRQKFKHDMNQNDPYSAEIKIEQSLETKDPMPYSHELLSTTSGLPNSMQPPMPIRAPNNNNLPPRPQSAKFVSFSNSFNSSTQDSNSMGFLLDPSISKNRPPSINTSLDGFSSQFGIDESPTASALAQIFQDFTQSPFGGKSGHFDGEDPFKQQGLPIPAESPISQAVRATRQSIGSGMQPDENVPLDMLPYFRFLSDDAQRSIMKQLIDQFQHSSIDETSHSSQQVVAMAAATAAVQTSNVLSPDPLQRSSTPASGSNKRGTPPPIPHSSGRSGSRGGGSINSPQFDGSRSPTLSQNRGIIKHDLSIDNRTLNDRNTNNFDSHRQMVGSGIHSPMHGFNLKVNDVKMADMSHVGLEDMDLLDFNPNFAQSNDDHTGLDSIDIDTFDELAKSLSSDPNNIFIVDNQSGDKNGDFDSDILRCN